MVKAIVFDMMTMGSNPVNSNIKILRVFSLMVKISSS
jgi:hypothetical protein